MCNSMTLVFNGILLVFSTEYLIVWCSVVRITSPLRAVDRGMPHVSMFSLVDVSCFHVFMFSCFHVSMFLWLHVSMLLCFHGCTFAHYVLPVAWVAWVAWLSAACCGFRIAGWMESAMCAICYMLACMNNLTLLC